MNDEDGPAFLRGYVKPQPIQQPIKEWVKPIEYLTIGNCSFEMLVPPKPGRKPNNGKALPLALLEVGQSFNVQLSRSEDSLRTVMRQAQAKDPAKKFRLIHHETHYEIGRIN